MIFGNDVAKFDFRVPNLLNLPEFQDFQEILGYPSATSSPDVFSHDDLDTYGPYLLLQDFLCLCPAEHPFAILENPTLRRDESELSTWSFGYHQASSSNRTIHRWRTWRDRNGQVHRRWPGFRNNPVFLLFVLASFSPFFWCSSSSWKF